MVTYHRYTYDYITMYMKYIINAESIQNEVNKYVKK